MELGELIAIYKKNNKMPETRYNELVKAISSLTTENKDRLLAEAKTQEIVHDGGNRLVSFATLAFAVLTLMASVLAMISLSEIEETLKLMLEILTCGLLIFLVVAIPICTKKFNAEGYVYIRHILESHTSKASDTEESDDGHTYNVKIKRTLIAHGSVQ